MRWGGKVPGHGSSRVALKGRELKKKTKKKCGEQNGLKAKFQRVSGMVLEMKKKI